MTQTKFTYIFGTSPVTDKTLKEQFMGQAKLHSDLESAEMALLMDYNIDPMSDFKKMEKNYGVATLFEVILVNDSISASRQIKTDIK